MKITIEKKDNAIIVIIAGRLDTSTSVQAEKEFQTLYNTEAEEIIFDCSELEYVSSSGLRLFLSILKLSRSEGKHVFFSKMNDYLKEVFTMTGFTSLFEFK